MLMTLIYEDDLSSSGLFCRLIDQFKYYLDVNLFSKHVATEGRWKS